MDNPSHHLLSLNQFVFYLFCLCITKCKLFLSFLQWWVMSGLEFLICAQKHSDLTNTHYPLTSRNKCLTYSLLWCSRVQSLILSIQSDEKYPVCSILSDQKEKLFTFIFKCFALPTFWWSTLIDTSWLRPNRSLIGNMLTVYKRYLSESANKHNLFIYFPW
jgi:hypothetical protein